MTDFFTVSGLLAEVESKKILNGINLSIKKGETHAIMGPNGSGKSTLANVVMGHPFFTATGGEIVLDGENVLEMTPDQRAKKGIFMAFQYPKEIPGVPLESFLRASYITIMKSRDSEFQTPSVFKFKKILREKMNLLKIEEKFLDRFVNKGFSGGEKKKIEMLQMLLLEPKLSVLDETDSGLDVDALKIVAQAVNIMRGKGMTVLIITHYQRILHYIEPDHVHVMYNGKIVKSGDSDFANELEKEGYEGYVQ